MFYNVQVNDILCMIIKDTFIQVAHLRWFSIDRDLYKIMFSLGYEKTENCIKYIINYNL